MLMANIWRVFGVLLEYCSRSDFMATVRQIEREKDEIVDKINSDLREKEKELQGLEVRDKQIMDRLATEKKILEMEREQIMIEKN